MSAYYLTHSTCPLQPEGRANDPCGGWNGRLGAATRKAARRSPGAAVDSGDKTAVVRDLLEHALAQ